MTKIILTALLCLLSFPSQADTVDFFLKVGGRTTFVPGFHTYFSGQYVAPEKNLSLLREIKEKISIVKISDFTANDPDMATLICRMSYPVYAPEKIPFVAFVAGALKDELSKAELYSLDSGVELSGRLNSINFESFGSGKWTIAATFSVPGKEPVVVKHETPFSIPFSAVRACGQVKDNLVPAIQEFLFAVYSDSKFQELLH